MQKTDLEIRMTWFAIEKKRMKIKDLGGFFRPRVAFRNALGLAKIGRHSKQQVQKRLREGELEASEGFNQRDNKLC